MQDIIRYGSKDSTDVDIMVVAPNGVRTNEELKEFITQVQYQGKFLQQFQHFGFHPLDMDFNVGVIEDGQCTNVYKGTVDEFNNMLYYQFDNFEQPCFTGNPIKVLVQRDVGLKIIRTLRGLLSQVSRTKYRKEVKQTLREGDLFDRIDVLRMVYNDPRPLYNKLKVHEKDFNKFVAFQTVQTLELISGHEIFEKSQVIDLYPDLERMITRQPECEQHDLVTKYVNMLLDSVAPLVENGTKFVMDADAYELSVLCKT